MQGCIRQHYWRYDLSGGKFVDVLGGAWPSWRALCGGFGIRFRLKQVPEPGWTLLELPGSFRLSCGEVLAGQESAWERRENLRMREEGDGRCRVLTFELCLEQHEYADYRQRRSQVWERLSLSVPVWHLPEPGADIAVLYDGLTLQLLVDGEVVNADNPVGVLHAATGEWVSAGPAVFAQLQVSTDVSGVQRQRCQCEIPGSVQYYTPRGFNTWAGDVVLFWHDGVFHALYFLDRHHHGNRWGCGAHHFQQLTSRDLVHWVDEGPLFELTEPWQSIGTGTMVFHRGKYLFVHGWHTSRVVPPELTATPLLERLAAEQGGAMRALSASELEGRVPSGASYAVSDDGIHFEMSGKVIHTAENPSVYVNERGGLSMYCGGSTWEADEIDGEWRCVDRQFPPCGHQEAMLNTDECPSFFDWEGDRYLIMGGSGFWHRPAGATEYVNAAAQGRDIYDGLDVPMASPYGEGRMLLAGWINGIGWGSCLVFREMLRYADGHLGMKWVPELVPECGEALPGLPRAEVQVTELPVSLSAPPIGTSALYELQVQAPEQGRLALRFRDETHPEGDCEFQLDFERQRLQFATLERGQTALCRRLLTLRESLQVMPSDTLGMNIRTVDGYHAGSRDFALENVDVMSGTFMLRVCVHADAKMRSTVLDVEVAGQRTMISQRVGLKVSAVEMLAEGTVWVPRVAGWNV